MSRKRDKIKGLFGVKSSSSSSALALAPSAATVGSSVPMAVLPTGATPVSFTTSVSQSSTLTTRNHPNIDKARTWWREHRQGLMGALESALTIAEKALVVVPPAQAAVGAAGAALKALRLMDDNMTTIEEIVDRVDEIIQDLVGLTFPSPVAFPTSISPDAVVRIDKFNERLNKIKTAATGHSSTVRNFHQRLLDAERISEELDDAWKDVSLAYDELIVATALGTEAKVVKVHARVEDVQDSVTNVRGLVVDVQTSQMTQKEEALLDRLQPVKSAFHDAHGAAPACLEGTRTQILGDISAWMADPSAKLVYWLTGVAGTGKTTIAQSVAYMAEERRCLAATFFFSRTAGSAGRRRAAAVIPTLVYQLAYRHDIFRDCICRAVSSDRDICERLVVKQAKTLFADTLQSSTRPLALPLVIVLDALDECDKENGREGGDLIPVLLHSLDKLPFSVKIFITSRPEPSIKNMFGQADIHESTIGRALHRDIEQGIVREDIGRYFRYELDKLAKDRSVPPPFPSDVDFQKLVDRAGNLFIYVRTIVMYVSSQVESPVDRLADVLRADMDSEGASEQFADLDALYTQILACALDGVGRSTTAQRQLRDVLASLVLIQESLPVTVLSVLAGVEERQYKKILQFLSSVLLYDHVLPEPVRLMHPSFPDFLISGSRCRDNRYFVNGAEYHSVLALRCLQIMTADLRRDICGIRDPSLSNADVPNLNQPLDSNASFHLRYIWYIRDPPFSNARVPNLKPRLDKNASAQLRYACKFWHVHVQLAGRFHPDLITAMDVFCTKHLLHWLELLSWMGEVPIALRDLPLLLGYLENFDDMRQGRIHTLLTDIDRLLVMYREPIIHSALHVYYSALATMPSCLLLKQMAADDGYRIPLLISKRAPSWGLREIIVDQRGQVHCVAYSPNGTLIATIAHHQPTDSSTRFVAVQVWDLSTGTALYIWNQYYKNVTEPRLFGSATFSPNGQWIAFTEHSTLRVWDVVTGSQECIMEGHSDTAWCITFSPDSTTIVSGSWDRTLRVWDASTGAERLVMIGHTASVNALAFAPDGQTIVSASSDGTLRVWDVLSGTKLRVIHADRGELYCVAFSPDGATIASGGWNGTIQLWSATSGSRQHAFEGHNMGVRSFAFSPDGKSIVSCDMDGLARIWDAMTGIEKRSLRGGVRSVAYSPDGKSIALGLADGTTRIWDANTDATTHSSTDGHQAPINSVSFSPDGMLIASGSDDCTLRVWNANTGAEQHVMHVKDAVTFVAFSPDSRTIACGQLYGTVQWWDVASGLEQSSRTGQHESAVRSVAFSPDSKSIVSYSDSDGTARVWDMITGAVQHTLTHPRFDMDPKRRAVFSTDGKAIILRKYYRSLTGVVIGSWDLTTTTQPQYAESTSAQVHDFRASEQSGIGLPRYLHAEGSPWIQQLHNGPHREEQRDICWLPKEFRGTMTYSGTKVCVGGQNGAITILDFSPVGLLQYDGGQYRSLSGSAFISIRSESLRR